MILRNLRIIIIREASYERRDLINKLRKAGYKLDRTSDHTIFEKQACRPVQVPNHREIKETLAKKILKDAGLE